MEESYSIMQHHIFCNYFMNSLPCKYCTRLWEKYPYQEGESPEEAGNRIMKEEFPNAVKIR